MPELKPSKVVVPVVFHVDGEWGGRGFSGHLEWQSPEPWFEGSTWPDEPAIPVLVVDGDAGDPWRGLVLTPKSLFPGQYASGSAEHSGKFFVEARGVVESRIGDSPRDLKPLKYIPRVVFCWPAYLLVLHFGESIDLSAAQRDLLLAAIRYDQSLDARFAAGATILPFFSREELEGTKKGQIFYNVVEAE